MSVLNKDDGRFVVRYRDEHGINREKSFGRGAEAEAAAIDYDRRWKEYHAAMRRYQVTQPVTQQNVFTFKMLVEEYLQHSAANGRSKNHIYSMKTTAEARLYPTFGDLPLTEIDYAKHILPFIQNLQNVTSERGEPLSPCTINRYCNFLKAYFNYAIHRGYMNKNPMSLWTKLYEPKKDIQLTREDIVKIRDNAAPHIAWAIEVAYHLGVRTGESELLSLTWQDVDYTKKRVHVFGRKTKTHRWVPVSDAFLARLQHVQEQADCEYVVSYRGGQVKNLHKGFANACKKAGITYPVRMYDIRHRFTTELLNAGTPVAAVSKALGHSRKSTTLDVYYECLPEDMESITARLPVLPPQETVPVVPTV